MCDKTKLEHYRCLVFEMLNELSRTGSRRVKEFEEKKEKIDNGK